MELPAFALRSVGDSQPGRFVRCLAAQVLASYLPMSETGGIERGIPQTHHGKDRVAVKHEQHSRKEIGAFGIV